MSANPGTPARAPRRAVLFSSLLGIVALLAAAPALARPLPQVEIAQAGFNARINFTENASSPVVSDPLNPGAGSYTNDFGEPYGAKAGGLTFGWVAPGTGTPQSLVGAGRIRNGTNSDQRLVSFIHMQGANNPTVPAGDWEIAVPNGAYVISVSVGGGSDTQDINSVHALSVEGQVVIAGFTPAATNNWDAAAAAVTVTDGRLTIRPTGGTNTKINYAVIQSSPNRPFVTNVTPNTSQTEVLRSAPVTTELHLLNYGGLSSGVNETTLTNSTVKLWRSPSGNMRAAQIPANVNTSGGGDTIVLQPTAPLDPNTRYLFEVTDGVKDLQGASFLPFTSVFSTGAQGGNNNPNIVFDKVALAAAQGLDYSTVVIGPDGRLYAGTLSGEIVRWPLLADGTLGAAQIINTIKTNNGGNTRFVIGMVFDAQNNLWVTHNYALLANSPDNTGKVSRLSGANLETYQDYVVNLPRSAGDHLANSLAFGPDGALYMPQGSMSAMGAPDNAWGNRAEHLLTGALLRLDVRKITAPPLDARTPDAGGSYNPFATNAPLTIYATGIRNAYDLVFHSNGQLYVPANGSAAGGNTPASDLTQPGCANRIDGPYSGPAVTAISNVTVAQNDWLFRVVAGGYYGHPNPLRCEWVLNGGNPTGNPDFAQVAQYPAGTQPDRNYRGAAFDFGQHYSPNGAIEYRSNANNGALQGKLLVIRYSGGDDIIILNPNGLNGDVPADGWEVGNPGITGFDDPLDIVEQPSTGNLYVTELGAKRITLLKPRTPPTQPPIPTPEPPTTQPTAIKRFLPITQR